MYEKQRDELKRAAERKRRREEKRSTLPWGESSRLLQEKLDRLPDYQIKKKRKPARISARRQAFNRLRDNCRKFVLLRAEIRSSGFCEVKMACRGQGDIEVWYHIFPQASGNALKYDDRNILGSCNSCNAGEYRARKNFDDSYQKRHREILGEGLFKELKRIEGRRQITTVEANELADLYKLETGSLNER